MCHVVNLVVQAILAALGEADNPDDIDYYTLNKERPLHLDIDADPEQIALDREEFQDEVEDEIPPEESVTLEEEEKVKAMESPLSKVRTVSAVKSSYSGALMFMLATLHYKQNCLVTPATEEISEMCNINISEEKLRVQGQARGLSSRSRCPYTLELYTCNDSSGRASTRSQSQTNHIRP